jgi:hypothetical protein
MTMQMTQQMSVAQAFSLLKSGKPVFLASAPEGTKALRGAWKGDDGDIHHDLWAVYTDKKTASSVARAYGQGVFALKPAKRGNGQVYLLKDSIRNRVFALRYAGNYATDGEHLLVVCLGKPLLFEDEIIDWVPTKAEGFVKDVR